MVKGMLPKPVRCNLCGEVFKEGTAHACNPDKRMKHLLKTSRLTISQFGTIGEKIFYKRFFAKRYKVKRKL